jgi:lysophospholipase
MAMTSVPALEERFLEPQGWQFHSCTMPDGTVLRTGSLAPANPKATVVVLPGRTEYIEKYFETARDLIARNLAVWIVEWRGQGKSTRINSPHRERNYSPDFITHADDLHHILRNYIKTQTPLIMLAHSMGGNIGLRYLHKYPGTFKAAAFTAPMVHIRDATLLKFFISVPLSRLLSLFLGDSYVRGQKDWNEQERKIAGNELCGDPARCTVHDAWMKADPALRLGGVTYGWLYHAIASCALINRPAFLKKIAIPCLLAAAGHDKLVDDASLRKAAVILPHADLLELPDSGHEILMEKDAVRTRFFAAFDALLARVF